MGNSRTAAGLHEHICDKIIIGIVEEQTSQCNCKHEEEETSEEEINCQEGLNQIE